MVADSEDNLLIKNALTISSPEPVDILIEDGYITEVGRLNGKGLDAKGRLITPGFVNVHTHLDKSDLLFRMRPEHFGRSLEGNRQLLKTFKGSYTVEDIRERAGRVIREFIENGVTAIRTQVDVDSTGGLKPLLALKGLKDEAGVTLQLCAFPQEGVLEEGSRAMVEHALEEGADLLGGLPLVEKTREEQEQHLEVLFELSREYDVDLEVQVDESNNPQDFILPMLAEKTIENKMEGRVSATHCISLSAVDDKVASETIKLLVKAQLNVIVTPSANLITQFRVPDGVHRRAANSITRVKELLDAQVNVALGTDNIRDIFYPLGNCSILREMHVLASATRMTGAHDPCSLFNMASVNGARIMGLDYGVKPGCKADLIILNAASHRDALNGQPVIPNVIRGGRVVCESKLEVHHGRHR
ncbi:MAG: amidohydrolase family protein [Candidatus Altiarchaeota archaeon]